jgi:hypothetical protein
MRNRLILISLVSFSPLPAQTWRVDPKPVTSIGASDMSGSELLKVSSAHRLADGRIAVTNGDPREVRIFSKDGKLLSRFGRSGQGPGEFGYAIELLPTGGDSILVWDLGNRRRVLYGPDGTVLTQFVDPAGTAAMGPVGLFRRTLARMRPREENSCVKQAIAALPLPPIGTIRELFTDDAGRIWTREGWKAEWAVHTVAGRSLGVVVLPQGMELFQAGKDFVLGRITDEDGFEHVRLFRATLPSAPSAHRPCITPPQDTVPVSRIVAAATKTDMRNAMTAFEAYYSEHGKYPTSVDDLKGFRMSEPDDGVFAVSRVGAGGYVFGIFNRKTTYMCLVGVGDGIPEGWPNGVLQCGW